MKLQLGTKFEFDGESYVFEKLGKRKKITSRVFPSLIGKNKYESIGHALLDRFSLLEKEEIHPFYSVRGEIAERMADKHLREVYLKKHNADLATKRWENEEVNFDNFPNNPDFGGLIDIAIAAPQEYRAVVEVKSKRIDKYKAITEKSGSDDETLQGEFLAYLSGVMRYVMVYVFFEKIQELRIVEFCSEDYYKGYEINAKIAATKIIEHYQWYPYDFKYHIVDVPIRIDVTKQNMEKAKNTMDAFEQNRTIPQVWLSPDERIYLNTYFEHKTGTKILQAVDRPF